MSRALRPPPGPDLARIGEITDRVAGDHFTLLRLGPIADLGRFGVEHPLAGAAIMGKVFLKEPLGLTGMEISFGVLPAYASMPFRHRHKANEEVYLFLKGTGQIQIDGQVLDVSEGTAVRVAPAGARAWRSTSAEDLFYIVIQARTESLTAWTVTDGEHVPGPVVWPGEG